MAATASAISPEAQAAEDLVFAVYYEGLPEERAHQLTAAGATHLAEFLRSGDREKFHSNIVLALGISAHPQTFETLEWYGRDEPGDVGPGVYRARVAVPVAMGHLSRTDDRALAWLARRARNGVKPPRWRMAGRRSDGLADTMRSQVLNGLAVSRREDAAELLAEISQLESDPGAGAALVLLQRLRSEPTLRPEATQ